MSQKTAIEWTDVSWNPVHGCSIVSTECKNCYAMTLSLRYGQTKKPWTPANAAENVILKPHKLREPLSRRHPYDKPCFVFVNSMSDLFHEQIPDDYIVQVFEVMEQASQHTFQVLTKRPERMRDWCNEYRPLSVPNVWLGVSIGLRQFERRADVLRGVPAAVRFISAEPLLGSLDGLDLAEIDWLIVGGESGVNHRPIRPMWVRDLRELAYESRTAFFFKQWGGLTPKAGGRLLDGRTYDEMPRVEDGAAVTGDVG